MTQNEKWDKSKVYIFHSKKTKNYTRIDNDIIPSMDGVSLQILLYILSKPKNWRVVASEVQNTLNITEYMWGEKMNVLEKKGHINMVKSRGTDGRFFVEYYVFERPEYNEKFINDTNPTSIF